MDRDCGDHEFVSRDVRFEHALLVRTAVLSRTQPTRALLDAGLKASGIDSGMPSVWQRPKLWRFDGSWSRPSAGVAARLDPEKKASWQNAIRAVKLTVQ